MLFFAENSVNMPVHYSKNKEHCVSQWQTGRAAGSRGPAILTGISRTRRPAVHQSAYDHLEDQQYCTSVSRGPAVHQSAEDHLEDQQYCESVSRGLAVHKSAEDQQYISQKRTSGTSVSRGAAVHQSAEEQK